jgi:hypothetical protein
MQEGIVEIRLFAGQIALIDDADRALVEGRRWHLVGEGYAGTCGGGRKGKPTIYMHRLLMPGSVQVDHINGDRLDNRRSNLRAATPAENSRNCKRYANNTTGYRGVHLHRQRGRWIASLRAQGEPVYIGIFDSPELAARAYDDAARERFGVFARFNFPRDGERGLTGAPAGAERNA